MNNKKRLYEMDLFDIIIVKDWEIHRVPNGWIFRRHSTNESVFVPWHNEFMPEYPPISEPNYTDGS